MAHYERGDRVPYGDGTVEMDAGFVPGRGEATHCQNDDCGKEFELIAQGDGAYYRVPVESQHGKFCSDACERMYRIDMRGSVKKALKLLHYAGYEKAAKRLEKEFEDYVDCIWGTGAVKDILQDALR